MGSLFKSSQSNIPLQVPKAMPRKRCTNAKSTKNLKSTGRPPKSVHLGAYIIKTFPQGSFLGKVVAWSRPYYRVVFIDWDEEDYTASELRRHREFYNTLEAQGRPRALIAKQRQLVHAVAVKWLMATEFLHRLVEDAEQLEASGQVN